MIIHFKKTYFIHHPKIIIVYREEKKSEILLSFFTISLIITLQTKLNMNFVNQTEII